MTIKDYNIAQRSIKKLDDLASLEEYINRVEQKRTCFIYLSEGDQNIWYHNVGKQFPEFVQELRDLYVSKTRDFIKEKREHYLKKLEEL